MSCFFRRTQPLELDNWRGRGGPTGTILGAILRHCGYGAAEVIDFLDAAYREARTAMLAGKSEAIASH